MAEYVPGSPPNSDEVFLFNKHHLNDDVTPWLRSTEWLHYFHGRSLDGMVRATSRVGTPQSIRELQPFWGAPDVNYRFEQAPINRSNQILAIILATFDRIMERASRTLRQTPTSIKEVFSSPVAQRRGKRPLNFLNPSTEKGYIRVWRQLLCFVFRSVPLRDNKVRWSKLGVFLDPSQEREATLIWDRLDYFLESHIEDSFNNPNPLGDGPTERSQDLEFSSQCTIGSQGSTSHRIKRQRPSTQQQRQMKRQRLSKPQQSQILVGVFIPPPSNTFYDTQAASQGLGSFPPGGQAPDSVLTPTTTRCRGRKSKVTTKNRNIDSYSQLPHHYNCLSTMQSSSQLIDPSGNDSEFALDKSDSFSTCRSDDTSVHDTEVASGESDDSDGTDPNFTADELGSDPASSFSGTESNYSDDWFPPETTKLRLGDLRHQNNNHILRCLPSTGQAWLEEWLLSFCIGLLTGKAGHTHGDKFRSVIVAFTAVCGIQPKTKSFYDPYSYTSKLAALLWVSRVLLLEYALPVKPYEFIPDISVRTEYPNYLDRALSVHSTFAGRDSWYPMAEILRLMSKGLSITRHQKRPPNVHWSDDGQVIHHEDEAKGIPMDSMRAWVQGMISRLASFLDEVLLWGYKSPVVLADLQDRLRENTAGFSFLDLLSLRQRSCEALLQLCETPPDGIQPLRQKDTWNFTGVGKYLSKVKQFLQELAVLINVTWGQPSRGTELWNIKWQNTSTSRRNIFIHDGSVLVIMDYNKSRNRTESYDPTPRFLPPQVGRLVVLYLIHVRSLILALNREKRQWQKKGSTPAPPTHPPKPQPTDDHYLFTVPGARHTAERGQVSRMMFELSEGAFEGARLTTRKYRHIAIGITKKHLPSQASEQDLAQAAALLQNVFAAQAGHHPSINRHIYARERAIPLADFGDKLDIFQRASHLWHDFILQPVSQGSQPRVTSSQPTPQFSLPPGTISQPYEDTPWPFLKYFTEWKLLICTDHGTAIPYTSRATHLQQHYADRSITRDEVQAIEDYDILRLEDVWDKLREQPNLRPFPFLELKDGYGCHWPGCRFITSSRRRWLLHRAKVHEEKAHRITRVQALMYQGSYLVEVHVPNTEV